MLGSAVCRCLFVACSLLSVSAYSEPDPISLLPYGKTGPIQFSNTGNMLLKNRFTEATFRVDLFVLDANVGKAPSSSYKPGEVECAVPPLDVDAVSFCDLDSSGSPIECVPTPPETECECEKVTPLPLISNMSEHNCVVRLDADDSTPGVQTFAAGQQIELGICVHTIQTDTLYYCTSKYFMSSELVSTTSAIPVPYAKWIEEIPATKWLVGWEDTNGGGDLDYNDLVVELFIEDSCPIWPDAINVTNGGAAN